MRKCLVFLVLFAFTVGAAAQGLPLRQLPPKGERGRLGDPQPLPVVVVGGKTLRLAPGGLVFDQSNRTIVHASLPPQADVFYTLDSNGDIRRLYILTAQERTALDKSPRPTK